MADIQPNLPSITRWSPSFEPGRPRSLGVVIHSTRSGQVGVSLEQEYQSTIGYFLNPASASSTHFVVGPGQVCRMVGDDNMAWHARENNATHLGMEIAQPTPSTPFTDWQYRAAAAITRLWCEKYGIPQQRVWSQYAPGIIGHEDTEQGAGEGKSDPGGLFDWDLFIGYVNAGAAPGGGLDEGTLAALGLTALAAAVLILE